MHASIHPPTHPSIHTYIHTYMMTMTMTMMMMMMMVMMMMILDILYILYLAFDRHMISTTRKLAGEADNARLGTPRGLWRLSRKLRNEWSWSPQLARAMAETIGFSRTIVPLWTMRMGRYIYIYRKIYIYIYILLHTEGILYCPISIYVYIPSGKLT